jgi:hypothetical protein
MDGDSTVTENKFERYTFEELLIFYNQLSSYERQIGLGGAIAAAAVRPEAPGTLDEIQIEIYKRKEAE